MPEVETKPKDDALDTEAQEDATKSADSTEDDDTNDEEANGASSDLDEGDEDDGADDADDAAGADKSTTDDDSTRKSENRLGFQLRQIRTNDPYVATVRRNLDAWVNEDTLTPEQREIRKLNADNYVRDVETKRAQLVADNAQIASEFPMFRPLNADGTENPEFNKALFDRALARFGRDSLELDDNGEIVGYKTPLLDYMREEADVYLAGVDAKSRKTSSTKTDLDKKPAAKKKQTTEAERAQMDAASEAAGGTSPTKGESEKDPLTEAFLSGFDSVK